ncbi:hypothetical protein MTO96_037767 [Rhipicephalus appendiculatus]
MSSVYFKQLDAEARQRYRQKLMFEGLELPDPLDADVVRFSFSSGCKNIPPVSAADIFVYLVEGACFYTKEQFKNSKLSDAYNSFVNGKVKRVSSFKAGKRGEGVVLIVACVEASQTLSKTYQSWCVVRDDGAVASAHCTCIAGLGECCTHVAALLFNVEATVRYGLDKQSPTDTACGWIEVTKKAAAAPVSDILFFKPKIGQGVPDEKPRPQEAVPTWSTELHSLFHQVKSLAPSTLLISSIFDSEETDSSPETSEQGPVQAVNQQLATQLPVGGMYSGIDATAAKELRLSNERTSSQEWKTELTVADDMPNLPAKSCVSKPSRSLINTKINCWVWLRRVMDGGCQMDNNVCSNELNMAMDTSPV